MLHNKRWNKLNCSPHLNKGKEKNDIDINLLLSKLYPILRHNLRYT